MIFDITFCPNTDCRNAGKYGRSMNQIQDLKIDRPLSFSRFEPDAVTGKCKYFIELPRKTFPGNGKRRK